MNKKAKDFYTNEILKELLTLPEDWQAMFKRLYSHKNLSKSFEDIVSDMPEEKLDWALTQITNSMEKIKRDSK